MTFLDDLARALAPDQLLTDHTEAYLRDRSDGTAAATPLAVVFPTSTEEVAAVVSIAAEHGVPIVPQGARSGLAGAANASEGALVISTERMIRILELDSKDQVATVEAGVLTLDLDRAADAAGLFYPPDPGSYDISTIGGNVATNAGGMRCVKYGVTGDFVRQLTVVLADGSIARTGHRTIKGVSGLDLTSLFVGSEGTLGIITEVTVALLPKRGASTGVLAAFPTAAAALAAADAIVASSRRPSVLEYLDAVCVAAITAYDAASVLPAGSEGVLLVQSDEEGRAETDADAYAAIATEHGATLVEVAHDEDALDHVMASRRLLHAAMRAVHGASLNEDVAVPRSKLPALLEGIAAIAAELQLTIGTGGHLGDGNVHPIVCYDPADHDGVASAIRAYGRIIELAVSLGGTASGEHGIGVLKRQHVKDELGPVVSALQWQVKRALDPRLLLNPGKKLPDD
ncbi:FAD-linked oxidase C-terminal domain-containing protein [Diaminobutyricimonas sp. TR449]|uniref:FAD-binding oxidoreductase n=1 Tax=Diaminobutyricimonas sp. TR449 TaxID=2708076 RepID=UPI0014241C27|nr:FAD-linked oxidase C-terminal domain-containing protein [Diaminobutyricimonas sp. TR449]